VAVQFQIALVGIVARSKKQRRASGGSFRLVRLLRDQTRALVQLAASLPRVARCRRTGHQLIFAHFLLFQERLGSFHGAREKQERRADEPAAAPDNRLALQQESLNNSVHIVSVAAPQLG
jgi:hypothetical protein